MLAAKPLNGTDIGSHYHELKDRLHQRVIELLDLSAVNSMSQEAVTAQLVKLVEDRKSTRLNSSH